MYHRWDFAGVRYKATNMSARKLMELLIVYTLITVFMCRMTWLVLRKTSLLERITRRIKARGLVKKANKKKRARKDGCDHPNNHPKKNSKTDSKLEKDSTKAKDKPIINTAKKKADKGTKMDKETTNSRDELAKKTSKKMTDDTKLDKDAAKVKGKLANALKKKADKEAKVDKDATIVKDERAKITLKKTDKETKVDQAPASEKDALKSKSKTGKGNKIEFHQILVGLSTLVLSEEEMAKVVTILREKNPSVLGAGDLELKEEKMKAARLEELLTDHQGAEKREVKLQLVKAQASCKETESLKMRIKQMPDETYQKISQLKLENTILKEVVETTWKRIRQTCSCR
ncbi:kinectin-like [Anguilla anguilla]|uniref:kinectin-like n=1 Tax=Anguilla anguilla TaxID=7936 RepID=UPI0015AB5672|nr:kinectin-like [Anguilla anguilla]